ncbi:PASTA domain containing protein [Geobacter metallireducens RCH3]|uniref:PASTA-related domain protein n=1 Tax=Geobacter metallireducens (strain ATCC 53774 / DSM 7210 / GS-15) TaxID=269799 RepID=Q39WE1_GEOMG|nr:PASTA domain-containing protein [Geobacter metallireducens]ABB31433.1 PASTA-related domain protein [Geobacter metallireducens GS-15]EHP88481.1 PASTA domain containing protein [Geobacter metallireducens RCH3]
MEGIFISYRREESAGHAGRVYDRLRERFGRDRVFMDVSAIEPGVDFVEAIDRAVGSCAVLLVIIGRRWIDCTDAAGRRRLDDPRDFIRLEVGTALRRNIRVVPVLVQDAAMPGEADLPDDLKLLARRNAIEINDTHWDSDLAQLVDTLGRVLEGTVGAAAPGGTGAVPAVRKNRLAWLISSITAIVVALAGLFTGVESLRTSFVKLFKGSPPVTTTGTTTPSGQGQTEPVAITVPRVTGMEEQQAVEALRVKGLHPQVVRQIVPEAPPGTVTQQEPPEETSVTAGAMVNLVVAVPPERPEEPPPGGQQEPPPPKLVTVPKLAGKTLGDAKAALATAGLRVGTVEKRKTDTSEPGTIIGQTPKAGSKLAQGRKVRLVVAVKPPEPELVTVPNVVKQPRQRALKMLVDAGLQPGAETRRPTTRARPGTILDQKIRGGTTAKRGTRVDLVVAAPPDAGRTAEEPTAGKMITQGRGEIRQTYLFDLDAGSIAQNGDADIWFEAETETERYLTPRNGASLGFTREKPTYENCSKVKMTQRRIPIQRIPENANVCVRTNRGNLSAFKIREPVGPSPGVMKISYITWEGVR